MLRSLAVLTFIAGVGTAAVYVARRPTLARGSVVAADLMQSNQGRLRAITCDDRIAIGVHGAEFSCRAEFLTGEIERVYFTMDRAGIIRPASEAPAKKVNKADPWGD